jgi:GxxExxY protein
MELNDLIYKIRGAIFSVHKFLGPGLLESVYEAALAYELSEMGLEVETQVALPVVYKSVKLEMGFKLDILVNNQIIIEIKSVDILNDVHKKQLLNYLKLSKKRIGLLVNFNALTLVDKESLVRIING